MRRRKRNYIVMMGVCLLLFALSGGVVRHFSVPAAIVMAVVAMIIPPFAVMVTNTRDPDDPEDDDPYDSQDDRRP